MVNQNFVAIMYNAMFPLLNTARVYVSSFGVDNGMKQAFLRAFNQSLSELDNGSKINIEPEWYIAQFKNWAKSSEESIFMSMLSYHPEQFYPQQIEDMPVDEDFWWGMFQKELWETYEHDSWSQEREYISKEMWESN